MKLIFIYGPGAVGKLTIARELASLTGLPVFHNHLAVDAALSVFEFASEPFVRLRHKIWLQMFEEALSANRSLIFTFSPEPSVPLEFVPTVIELVAKNRGEVIFVKLECPYDELERRIENPSRAEFRKLRSLEVLRKIHANEPILDYGLPEPKITIDTCIHQPSESAKLIAEAINLA